MVSTNTYQAQANELSQKLWAIANELRGQMDASEFKNYILGVIFYRYLSERTEMYMAEILKNDGVTYEEAFKDDEYRPVVEEWSLSKLGYVIKPENLFRNLIRKITKFDNDADKFSVEDFEKAINDLVGSTMGYESNKAFDGLFNDMRLRHVSSSGEVFYFRKRLEEIFLLFCRNASSCIRHDKLMSMCTTFFEFKADTSLFGVEGCIFQ